MLHPRCSASPSPWLGDRRLSHPGQRRHEAFPQEPSTSSGSQRKKAVLESRCPRFPKNLIVDLHVDVGQNINGYLLKGDEHLLTDLLTS